MCIIITALVHTYTFSFLSCVAVTSELNKVDVYKSKSRERKKTHNKPPLSSRYLINVMNFKCT